MRSGSEVRSRIAELILGELPGEAQIGTIALHDHQLSAVQRLREAIQEFGGAVLCDEVGMGKTYVAIAIARDFSTRLIVAPAALVSMWQSALQKAETAADILTFEALSRIDADDYRGRLQRRRNSDFVIIDEAHHARNPRTNRYFALEHLVRGAKVLLLSATPIHNRREDLVALFSLFLGSRARTMTTRELAQCVVRREQKQVERSVPMPSVRPTRTHEVSDEPAVVDALMNLPPPVPVRDGGIAGALVGRGLVHQWASSEAALREALRRRIARTAALCISLEAGTYPTLRELETWIYHDGALQLGFAELLSEPVASHRELLDGVRAHLRALQGIQARFASASAIDTQRADIVKTIRGENSHSRIVAFAQYAETVAMLYRRLAPSGRLALLTSHGARIAGGSLSRKEAISRFAPVATGSRRPADSEAIQLLLTTDLLSEGVNLQDADTIFHLDIPWTAARMEQRVGRLARLGSSHSEVHVHVLRPPASAIKVLEAESIVARKWSLAHTEATTPRKVERLREILKAWRQPIAEETNPGDTAIPIGATTSDAVGFVAAVTLDGTTHLVVSRDGEVSTDLDAQLDICSRSESEDSTVAQPNIEHALSAIRSWCATQRAASAAGVDSSVAQRRPELLARIDAAIDSAPPHLRNARLLLATRARIVATAPQCAVIESELEKLARANVAEEEWLAAIANIDTQQAIATGSSGESDRIHALLLLIVKRHRFQSRRDPESP